MKKDRTCQHCGVTFENIEGKLFSNHVQWCEHNLYRDDEERSRKISEGLSYIAEKRREDYYQNPNYCSNCGGVLSFENKSKRRKFCDKEECKKQAKLAPIFQDNPKETKWAKCIDCDKDIEVNKRTSPKNSICDECKIERKKSKPRRKGGIIHKGCGQSKYECKRPDICKKHQLFPALIKYFGMDESKIGTSKIYEEFERIRNLVHEDYWKRESSLPEMIEKYGHYNSWNFVKILHSLGIETRNWSEAGVNAYKNGKIDGPCSYYYKYGWHTTWNNKQVFYRSSYELDYAQELDNQQIDYNMEGLRILYWDSQKQIQRIAIPDFYLPETNIIVEIKSSWTYDEQNMRDKFQAYKEHGLNCKLILDKQEVS